MGLFETNGAAVNVVFFAVEKEREQAIAEAFATGVQAWGDTCRIMRPADCEGPDDSMDVGVIIGVKGYSRQLMTDFLEAGKHFVYIDKGYTAGPRGPRSKYMRMSVDSFQPLSYFQKQPRPDDRLRKLGITLRPSYRGHHVIVAGGSLKYALWHGWMSRNGIDPATVWAEKVVSRAQRYTNKPLVYRPKPSWNEAIPVLGARFSRPPLSIEDELKEAWALVTFGSNAAVDAVIAGVPVFILGDGIAKPLGTDDLSLLDKPIYPTDQQRYQFLCDVAYCQWDLEEMKRGEAWQHLRMRIIEQEAERGL